jgi:hypothetical protein
LENDTVVAKSTAMGFRVANAAAFVIMRLPA